MAALGFVIGAVLLLVLAGVMAAAEAALTSVPHQQVRDAIAEGRGGAERVSRVLADLPTHINVLTFIRVLCEAGATVFIGLAALSMTRTTALSVVLSIVLAAVLIFTVAEVSPRTAGRRQALRFATGTAWLVRGLRRALGPLARVLVWLGNMLAPGKVYRDGPFVTEDQLRDLVNRASAVDVIEDGERDMIESVFELGDTQAKAVMVPRTDLVTLESGTVLHEAISVFLRSGFSRIPVVGDDDDDVRGVLYLKDIAARIYLHPDQAQKARVEDLARPVVFVPETKRIDELLRQMQSENVHVSIVIDEYGGTAGLVTIEDIVEEIVGEIDDEYDRSDDEIEDLGNGSYRMSTRTPIHDVAEVLDMRLEDEDVTSLGGLFAKALEQVPIEGSEVTAHGLHIVALPGQGRRHTITHLTVTPLKEDA